MLAWVVLKFLFKEIYNYSRVQYLETEYGVKGIYAFGKGWLSILPELNGNFTKEECTILDTPGFDLSQ